MKYLCSGYDKAGKPVTEAVEAADKPEAIELMRRKGVFVTQASVHTGAAPAARGTAPAASAGGARPNLDRVADFFRQLALLVSTGTPLVDAMDSLRKQISDPAWRAVVDALYTRVEEGTPLSEAMAAFPRQFDGVSRSLVAAGEQGGKLDAMLERLSKLTRQQARIRKTVQGALVYPALLIAISVAVVSAMLGFVLPRFESLFKTLHVPLPITTEWLMAASEFIRSWWWAIGLTLAGAATLVWAYLRTAEGQATRDSLLVRLPQIGRLTRSFATARIARMLGVLLEGKVALLDSLALTRQSMGNTQYVALITKAEESVTRGESVSAALNDPTLINPSVCDAIRSAERSGQIGSVLISVADHLDEDNEMLVKTMTGLLEPIILVVLGLVVGTMAISMFLPLFDLTAAGAGGGAP